MSAFLGPIHYWLYNKIKLQDAMVEKILLFSGEKYSDMNLREELNERYGYLEERPLEEIIDTANIHGWLQERVAMVELRLAFAVNAVLEREENALVELKELFFELGKEYALPEDRNAMDIYTNLNDTLLDGMPCDHANSLIVEKEQEVVFKRNICVHADYWEGIGADVKNYYILREKFIKGYISKTDAVFEKLDETTSRIVRIA